ncbi:MAG: PilN domain-containing protein [Vicinamibacterales bacterium]|nr:PilN domain-containing protein [Vicinamibacterales bacterium]
MIKINLLAVDRDRSKRKAKFQVGQKVTVGSSLILVATALLLGWWYWSLKNDSAQLDQQIADAQRETVRLRNVIEQVRQFEARRAQLQQRVTLIEQLRKGQTGPVHLLDVISRSLPESMWLTEMKQNGPDVQIDGRCTSLTALSDFISSLEVSGLFDRPVEIIDSQVEVGTTSAPELVRFSVKAKPTAIQ